jgi:hypothetical protein
MARKGAYCYACKQYLTCRGSGFMQLHYHLSESPACKKRIQAYYRALEEHPRSHGKEQSRDRRADLYESR